MKHSTLHFLQCEWYHKNGIGMHQHLYFICPSDHLEPIINSASKNDNYYYTSLGNSVVFNSHTVHLVEHIVRKNNITEISFILSNDNSIINDALNQQGHSHIRGLRDFYNDIVNQKEKSETFWRSKYQIPVLSYHLNNKIKELQLRLGNSLKYPIEINGKVYNRQKKTFDSIHSDLICLKNYNLN